MADESNNQETVFDTDRQYLGDVYAKALLGMAAKTGTADSIVEELESFVDVLGQIPQLRITLESPQVSFSDKDRLIDKAIKGKASEAFLRFVKVVTSKGRADCLGAIRNAARSLQDEAAGRIQATMTTAHAVDQATQQKVAERLGKVLDKQVSITAMVDQQILGGLIVRVGDTVYDGSLRNELKQVRSATIGRANQEIRKSLDRFASNA